MTEWGTGKGETGWGQLFQGMGSDFAQSGKGSCGGFKLKRDTAGLHFEGSVKLWCVWQMKHKRGFLVAQ